MPKGLLREILSHFLIIYRSHLRETLDNIEAMLDAVPKRNTQDEFSVLQWVTSFILFAGLLFVFVTENWRTFFLLNVAGNLANLFYLYVVKAAPPLTLLGPHDRPQTKFRFSPLWCVGFGIMLAGLVTYSHIRMSALLLMSGLCMLAFNRYKNTTAR